MWGRVDINDLNQIIEILFLATSFEIDMGKIYFLIGMKIWQSTVKYKPFFITPQVRYSCGASC